MSQGSGSNPFGNESNPFGDPDMFSAPPVISSQQNFVTPVPAMIPAPAPIRPVAPAQVVVDDDKLNFYEDTSQPKPQVYGSMNPVASSPVNPPPYMEAVRSGTDDLIRQREELDQRAREIEQREAALRSATGNERRNNWPGFPEGCGKNCFYQDFEVDIPQQYKTVVKTMYGLWIAYYTLLFLNFFAALAYIIVEGVGSGTTFGLSILWVVLFGPCSFICWYRPIYKAFRKDSSLQFFVFFIVFTVQVGVNVVQALGIDACGTCGIINGLSMITASGKETGTYSELGVGIFMLVTGILFASLAGINAIMMLRVLRLYRSTGASFAQAQQELATSAMKNKNVREAAVGAAVAAARS